MERAIEPLKLTLINGEEKRFLLSMGGIKRLRTKFKAASLKELLDRDVEALAVPVFFEAMLDKGDLTEDALAELLPAQLLELGAAVQSLLGLSMPPTDPRTPIQPSMVQ